MAIEPEWTDPDELEQTAGTEGRAADFNASLGNLAFLHTTPQVAVRITSSQEIQSHSDTTIVWDDAPWDTADMWDESSPSAIVIPRAGVYSIVCAVLWAETGQTGHKVATFLHVNGDRRRGFQLSATEPAEYPLPVDTFLAEGDSLTFQVRHTLGVPLSLRPTAGRTTATVRWTGAPPVT